MTVRTGGLEAALGHHIVLNVSIMALLGGDDRQSRPGTTITSTGSAS